MKGTTVSLLALAAVLAATPAAAQDAANANEPGAATAQDQPAVPSSPGASSSADPRRDAAADNGIADIVVTAQKREQNLQDVPVVVSVLNQAQLESAGVRDIKDLQTITPGLNVTSSTSQAQTSIRIRGIGTVGDNPGLESSVGTVIDGVYRARSSVAFGDLGDLQRVEVLKGPQSTLFGKNMSAGVINVVTAAPSFTPKAEFIASYGNYNAWTVSGSATTGIIQDKLAVSVFGLKRERDGLMTIRTGAGPRTNTRDADVNNYALRGQILARPIDGLDIRIIGDYSKRDENCCADTVLIAGPTRVFIDALSPDEGLLQTGKPFSRIAYANRDTPNVITDWGVSGQLDYDLGGDFSATSITAWRYYKGAYGSDIDYSSADIWYRPIDQSQNTFNVFSQEARIAYNGERLKSIVGAFYSNERLYSEVGTRFGRDYESYFGLLLSQGASRNTVSALTGLPVGQNFIPDSGAYDRHFHKSVSFAAFTENTLTLTEGLDVTLGLRYSDEVKNVTSIFTNITPGNACRAALSRPIPAAAQTAI
ncbi:MAG: TonB-dependent receptor, partial [Methylobacterium mesophilicum]|nr:TonB-dependent receptor [Methylobacterium mesophilicum]